MSIRSRQRGQSMVEFGILALLFTLIMFAIADFGMLLNGWVAISSAAREGARRASVGEHVHNAALAAQRFAPVPGLAPSAVKVVTQYCDRGFEDCTDSSHTLTLCTGTPPAQYGFTCNTVVDQSTFPPTPPNPGDPAPGSTVRLTVIADTFEVITPLVRPFFGCGSEVPHCWVPLVSRVSMRYEGPPP